MHLRRSKWLFIPLLIGGIVGYIGISALAEPPKTSPIARATTPAKPHTASLQKRPVTLGTPERLEIPSLHINAPILPVGVTKANDMDVPNSTTEVGWYKYGATPGHVGNAVLAGHLGIKSEPAVFWHLDDLKIGEYIKIYDTKHQSMRFKVTKKSHFTPSTAPREQIFGKTTKTNLNLITCSGSFMANQDDYTKRLVVFTQASS